MAPAAGEEEFLGTSLFLGAGKNRRRGLRIQGGSTMNCMRDGIFGNQRVMSLLLGG